MSGPRRLGAQWQFSVSGDSNHVYVFERSRDLQIWEPIFTNASRVESRIFTVPDSPAPEFYRARVAKRENTFALVVLGNIDNGLANLQLDSFDSSDPRFSTSGQYDPLKKKAAGDLGLFGSLTSASRLVRVYGQAWLSRNTTNFSLSPQSSIGDSLWLDAGNAGIQPGHLRQDLDGIYPTPRRPSAGGLAPVGGVVNGEFYQFVLGDGFWVLPDLVLTSSNNMLVTGRATLHVRGDINVAGQARIQLQSPASRLTIYAEGYTSLAGQGVVGAARPENFVYYGVGSNRQLAIRFSPFVGVIYAPQTECWVRPALTQRLDIIGSCVVKTLRLWDSVNIHLDESLQQVVLY